MRAGPSQLQPAAHDDRAPSAGQGADRIGARPAAASDRAPPRCGGNESHHAEPAIEGPQHLGFADTAAARASEKTGGGVKASRSSATARSSGRTRGRLSGKPPPVIWASAMNASRRLDRFKQRLHIKPGRRQQRLAERACRVRKARARPSRGRLERRCGAPAKSRWNAGRTRAGRTRRRRLQSRRAAAASRARRRRPRSRRRSKSPSA